MNSKCKKTQHNDPIPWESLSGALTGAGLFTQGNDKMKNIPTRIYLQNESDDLDGIDFQEIIKTGEVTWCQDQINSNDIEYIHREYILDLPSPNEIGVKARENGGDNRYRTAFIQGAMFIKRLINEK